MNVVMVGTVQLVYCTQHCTLVMVEADVLQPWLLEALAPGQRKQTLVRVQRYQRHNTGNNPRPTASPVNQLTDKKQ